MPKTRVLIVDDSLTVRRRLAEILTADQFEVIGEAADGNTAIALCRQLRPDVVTLDLVLPGLSGLAVTEYLMADCPTPILIVSSAANRGEVFRTCDALSAGAVEIFEKPCGDALGAGWERGWEKKFVAIVSLVARIKVIRHPRPRTAWRGRSLAGEVTLAPDLAGPHRDLVVIGTSTGGPAAMREILRALPPDFPVPILLVVHLGVSFAVAFAEWLDASSPVPVRYAQDGEPQPRCGQPEVLIAPPDRHLVVRNGRLRLTRDPERHSCRPSVDTLFESVAAELGPRVIACLLTGMGRDGATGLSALRRAGAVTVAQDEATSVVFGMPREAIALGAAERVLPLGAIAPALVELAGLSQLAGGAS